MSDAQVPRMPGAHRAGFAVVVGLHALIGLALLHGLAQTAIHATPPPVNAQLLRDADPLPKPLPRLPAPTSSQQLPTLSQLPAPNDPIMQPEPTISTSREASPPVPAAAPAGDGPVVLSQPAPAAPAPRMAARPAIGDVLACAPQGDDYPLAARRAEAVGTTRLRFTVSAAGNLVRSEVVRSAGPSREHRQLDKVAESKLAGCSFTPGADENGRAVGGTFEVDYVWRLDN